MKKPSDVRHFNFIERILTHKKQFLVVFLVIFTLTYAVFFMLDFVPEAPQHEPASGNAPLEPIKRDHDTAGYTPEAPKDMYPNRLIIDSLDRDISIVNPVSSDIATLDEALLEGVVRHPDSADFSGDGTIVLFGHSSYLPTVYNRNFQAFNGLQTLAWNDTIRVQSDDTEYTYRVSRVYKAKASEASVDLVVGSKKLALVTCNSFGSKDDRFIVEADFVSSRAL